MDRQTLSPEIELQNLRWAIVSRAEDEGGEKRKKKIKEKKGKKETR